MCKDHLWRSVTVTLLLVGMHLLTVVPVRAQGGPPWLQVWYFGARDGSAPRVEYRDAGEAVQASYTVTNDALYSPLQGYGLLTGWGQDALPVFNPYQGSILLHSVPNKPPDTDAAFTVLSNAVPGPGGQIAYTVSQLDMQAQQPGLSAIYVATPGRGDDRLVWQGQTTQPWQAVQPLGWSADGSTLLLHTMPQGIGGYILYWTYQDVQALALATGTTTALGNLDGYAADLSLTALVEYDAAGLVGLRVTQVATGQSLFYPLPELGEQPMVGGNAVFAPDRARVAYQVARSNPDAEKLWTIVVDLMTGESRVVLIDEATGWEQRYGAIGGWLNATTLVVGGTWNAHSALVDVTTGTLLREQEGAFLGYAEGITSAEGFAPSGMAYAQCPGAPISRLGTGQRGRVTLTGGGLTNVRQSPGRDAALAGQVAEGAPFMVTAGPVCTDGYAWWWVTFDDGLSGAVAEGDAAGYYLEPWQ